MKFNGLIASIIVLMMAGCSKSPATISSDDAEKIFLNIQLLEREKKSLPCESTENVGEELNLWFLNASVEDITGYKYPSSSARGESDVLSIYVQLKSNDNANFLLDVKLKNNGADIVCYDVMQIYR